MGERQAKKPAEQADPIKEQIFKKPCSVGIYYTAASGTGEPPAAQPSHTQGPPFTGGSADRI